MRHPDRDILNIGQFITALKESRDGANHPIWYRGQDRAAWSLIPGIGRPGNNIAAELATIKRFKQSASQYLPNRPTDDWEWIFLMQHHRAPTRLLDWSESSLVGLFFAVQNPVHDDHPAAVWCLDPIDLNKKSGHNRAFELDILAFGIDRVLDNYLPDRINERVDRLAPIAAIGPRNSPRMVAQAGTFTVIHAEATSIEAVGDQSHIWRLVIPAAERSNMREELKLLGISEHSLFPDLDRVALLAKGLVA
ncbi:FRG domain-containing protein [Mesorhizobium sp. B2-4-15]|uniref:FRG domain-containing protein n=1 Tax=Mesorhizobium sp. B2-4-15 TaxID=2589934 RepID=UPI001153E2D0|nr:FRG domain-containing protein [Mesorhizobium sp. B2-4-15]TPK64309.1 FRG domain-containing protein [Mesorhizobium sp. B2-4-15]